MACLPLNGKAGVLLSPVFNPPNSRPEVLTSGGLFGGAEQDRTVDILIANACLPDKAALGGTHHHKNCQLFQGI